jgi:hypothetical protein
MPSQRKFYRSVVTVEILSETPIPNDISLDDIYYEITEGDWSGVCDLETLNEEIDGPTMAKLLLAQGSDPGFFQLTAEGEEDRDFEIVDEDEDEDDEDEDIDEALADFVDSDEEQRRDEKNGLYPEHDDLAN